jgi:hypothetical protein
VEGNLSTDDFYFGNNNPFNFQFVSVWNEQFNTKEKPSYDGAIGLSIAYNDTIPSFVESLHKEVRLINDNKETNSIQDDVTFIKIT